MPITGKSWPCPQCGEPLGRVVKGELVLRGNVIANTSGPCLTVVCRKCGNQKVWFPKMDDVMQYIALYIGRMAATEIMDRLSAIQPDKEGD